MIHILFAILKILGILLLIILGILLFLILVILFVPIRYQLAGERREKDLSGNVVVFWLLHLVHFQFRYENKEKQMELYLLGLPVFALKKKWESRKKSSKKGNTKHKESAKKTEKSVTGESVTKEVVTKEIVTEEITTEEAKIQETKIQGIVPEERQKIPPKKKRNKISVFWGTIKSIPGKIKTVIKKIKLTIRRIYDKIKNGSEFLQLESTRQAIRLLLGECKGIFKHILPKKMRGNVIYGFEDPSITGQVLAVLSMFYPKYHKKLQIVPMFDQAILEGRIQMRGRIYGIFLLIHGLKIILNKDVKVTWQKVQQ